MDLIPPALIVARYFADEQVRVDDLHAEAEAAARAIGEHVEEHSGEEGALAGAMEDEKISKTLATARLREVKREDKPDPDEVEALERLIQLYADEKSAKVAANEARADLDQNTLEKYGDLTGADAKELVLDDKWAATVRDRIADEANALTLALVARIQQLGERYAETVGVLDAELEELEAKVAGHLAEMGVAE